MPYEELQNLEKRGPKMDQIFTIFLITLGAILGSMLGSKSAKKGNQKWDEFWNPLAQANWTPNVAKTDK